jgi:subtilisin-like proprotein convertase family protein
MKKIYTFLLPIVLIFYSISSYSQVFTNTTRTSIPDASVAIYVPITVSGLPSLINSTFGLKKICINMRHTYIGDLRVELLAPTGGDSMKISDRNGGGNDITTNLCFHETAPNFIVNYPILGATDYYGVESINVVNTGRNPNGTWYLVIQDLAGADTGYVDAISLEFGASPPPTHTRIITPPPPPGGAAAAASIPLTTDDLRPVPAGLATASLAASPASSLAASPAAAAAAPLAINTFVPEIYCVI